MPNHVLMQPVVNAVVRQPMIINDAWSMIETDWHVKMFLSVQGNIDFVSKWSILRIIIWNVSMSE